MSLEQRAVDDDPHEESGQPVALTLAWLHAPKLWFRERHDVLGRVYQVAVVARALLGLHAIGVNLILVLPRSFNPAVVLVASAVILGWTVFISWLMSKPGRRSLTAFIVDSLVTFAVVASTSLAVQPGDAELSLAGYWICGAAVYAAIFRNVWAGVGAAILVTSALFIPPTHLNMQRAGMAFTVTLLAACVGVLISQFRQTIVEQEQERIKVAALAERERLSRIVHDGALQVLALVEREGPALGPVGVRLATLAKESESQLRVHLQDREVLDMSRSAHVDLAAALDKYSSAKVTVSTMAGEVMASRFVVEEIEATLQEILANVDRHAGENAEAWVLLDQEVDDEVILWVRDNGVGMAPDQARRASDEGRFGIRDSIIGRISAIGGSAILKSAPGAGTEWELRIPIDVE